MKQYEIKEYLTVSGKSPYRNWLDDLSVPFKARIQARMLRLQMGNFGDSKSVGDGVHEIRFDFGSGYRVYFGIHSGKLILLLVGGDKKSQSKDILKAKEFWNEWKGLNHDKT